jgi:hypothetical protein
VDADQLVVIVDRVGSQSKEYHVCGLATCIECHEPVLLGDATLKQALAGAWPWCRLWANVAALAGYTGSDEFIGEVTDT